MTKLLRKKGKYFKVFALLLAMVMTVACFSITASAASYYQQIQVNTYYYSYSNSYNTGSDNRITVNGRAENVYPIISTVYGVNVYLQVKQNGNWVDINNSACQGYIPIGQDANTVFRDYVASPNTEYRLKLKVSGSGSYGDAIAHVVFGTWHANS